MRPLLALVVVLASSLASGSPLPPTLDVPAADRDKMSVCTDGKSHYVVIAPDHHNADQLYYGSEKHLSVVRPDSGGMVAGNQFLEPRYTNPTYNPSFRGLDMRLFSSVEFNADAKTCELKCGQRNLAMSILPAADAKKLLQAATFHQNPRVREPHALARDDHGVYYYVDRGNTPETKDNFRVFVGRKGALKLQKMKDVASDSGGEVYSTASGDLRLITGSEDREATWIRGEKSMHLVTLPVDQNLTLIWTTLGVYTGQPFGTPCDDL